MDDDEYLVWLQTAPTNNVIWYLLYDMRKNLSLLDKGLYFLSTGQPELIDNLDKTIEDFRTFTRRAMNTLELTTEYFLPRIDNRNQENKNTESTNE